MQTIGEYYHIYNRGAHKAPIFCDEFDYQRMLSLLYIKNSIVNIKFSNINSEKIYSYNRDDTEVDIIAYCLMPNHFHLVLKEITEGGISRFVHKLCTSYSMYFNNKYDHSGTVFQGQYKYKHVGDEIYLQYLIDYVHLNPFGIEEPDLMKTAKREHIDEAIEYSKNYEYSSFKDYLGEERMQGVILYQGRPGIRNHPR